jgi:hypothetical protein
VLDCQWLQRLHSYGLLSASFRPTEQIAGAIFVLEELARCFGFTMNELAQQSA